MAYIRPCRDCGQRISMREMRAGQWVAFDASTETPHRCGKITKADPNIKKLAKEKIKEKDSEGIDLGYSDIEEQNSPTNQVDEANEKIEEAKSSSYYEELKKYQFRNNDTKQTPWIDERAKVSNEHKHTPYSDDLPWIEDRAKVQKKNENIIQSNKTTVSTEHKKGHQFKNKNTSDDNFKYESKYKPRDFWWYVWRLIIAVWVFIFINYALGCPFVSCN